MKHLYKVSVDLLIRPQGSKRTHWLENWDIVNVVANGDAKKAIAKVKRMMKGEQVDWDENRAGTIERVRISEVVQISEVHG